MNFLSKFIFTVFTMAVMSLAVSAQRGDKKPPPKPKDGPVVTPGDKPKNPPDKGKPKKPGMSFVLVIDRRETDIA